ncbi:hypothetical protein [Carnobacterium maltaromaticum]
MTPIGTKEISQEKGKNLSYKRGDRIFFKENYTFEDLAEFQAIINERKLF